MKDNKILWIIGIIALFFILNKVDFEKITIPIAQTNIPMWIWIGIFIIIIAIIYYKRNN